MMKATDLAPGTDVKAPPPCTPQLCVLFGGAASQRSLWLINGLTGISAQVTEIHNYRVLIYVCMCVAPINSSGAFSLSNNGERNNIKIKC